MFTHRKWGQARRFALTRLTMTQWPLNGAGRSLTGRPAKRISSVQNGEFPGEQPAKEYSAENSFRGVTGAGITGPGFSIGFPAPGSVQTSHITVALLQRVYQLLLSALRLL